MSKFHLKLKLKAKTKRRITHLVTKKSLLKRKHSKHLTRSLFVGILTICAGSLAFASVAIKPVIDVSVRTVGTAGVAINAPTPAATEASNSDTQSGRGSWYALGLPEPDALTCASRTFPRGTYLQVEDLDSGKFVTCLVNDYGPAVWTGRVIDLSRGSFSQVDSLGRGTIPVKIKVVPPPATGYHITVPSNIGSLGYGLCDSKYTALFCETHRQDSKF